MAWMPAPITLEVASRLHPVASGVAPRTVGRRASASIYVSTQ
jgi:hypothetical protein